MRAGKKQPLQFNLSLINYLNLIKAAFFSPAFYAKQIPSKIDLSSAISFALVNLFLSFALKVIVESFIQNDIKHIFFSVSEIIFLVPIFLSLLIILTAILHLSAKILGGAASFRGTFQATSYASLPLIISGLPIINGLGILLMFYIISIQFKIIHNISLLKSIIAASTPLLLLLLSAMILGVLNSLILAYLYEINFN